MDPTRFDRLARSLAAPATRRAALQGLAAGGLGAALGLLGWREAGATHYFCRHVGTGCGSGRQCCSGRCRNGTCRAHHKGTCAAGQDTCAGQSVFCNGDLGCACYVTTGGASFCGAGNIIYCVACQRDKQCDATTGVVGSACIVCGTSPCVGGVGCIPPCSTPP